MHTVMTAFEPVYDPIPDAESVMLDHPVHGRISLARLTRIVHEHIEKSRKKRKTFSAAEVKAIRELAHSHRTAEEIAKRYSVHPETIKSIWRGKTYQFVK